MAQLTMTLNLPQDYDEEALRQWIELGEALENGETGDEVDEVEQPRTVIGQPGPGYTQHLQPQPQPQQPAAEAPCGKRGRRTKKQIEADNAAAAAAKQRTIDAGAQLLPPNNMPPQGMPQGSFNPPLPLPTQQMQPPSLQVPQPQIPQQPAPQPVQQMQPTKPQPVGFTPEKLPIYTHAQLETTIREVPNGASKFYEVATLPYNWAKVEDVPPNHVAYVLLKMYE